MSVDDTAKAILTAPPQEKVSWREYHHQTDWDDHDLGTFADLQAMAKLWLMRDEIITELSNLNALADDELGKDVSGSVLGRLREVTAS